MRVPLALSRADAAENRPPLPSGQTDLEEDVQVHRQARRRTLLRVANSVPLGGPAIACERGTPPSVPLPACTRRLQLTSARCSDSRTREDHSPCISIFLTSMPLMSRSLWELVMSIHVWWSYQYGTVKDDATRARGFAIKKYGTLATKCFESCQVVP